MHTRAVLALTAAAATMVALSPAHASTAERHATDRTNTTSARTAPTAAKGGSTAGTGHVAYIKDGNVFLANLGANTNKRLTRGNLDVRTVDLNKRSTKLAYAVGPDSSRDDAGIYVRNLPTGRTTNVLSRFSSRFVRVYGAEWSPDSSKILFVGYRLSDFRDAMYTVSANGRTLRKVVFCDNCGSGAWPTWSPDGTKAAWATGSKIYITKLASRSTHAISLGNVYVGTPQLSWSPNGNWFAFDDFTYVYRVRSSGGAVQQVTTDIGYNQPAYSPNNGRLAVRFNDNSTFILRTINAADGLNPKKIKTGAQFSPDYPDWSK